MGRICSTHGKDENAYDMLVGKPERNRPMCRWKDNIKMIFKEVGCGLDSPGSRWGLVVGLCEHSTEPLGFIKDGKFLD